MSVLVEGMNMPKSCFDCRFFVDAWCYAFGIDDWRNAYNKPPKGERLDNCPLTETPTPHGRLIDADAFSEEMRKRHKAASDWYDSVEDNEMLARAESTMMAFTECRLTLDAMQTVIGAEDGGSDV